MKRQLKPLTEDKYAQLVTCGIFYCRDSAKINGCGSLQTSSWLDSDMLRNRQQNIPLSVVCKLKKRPCKHLTTRIEWRHLENEIGFETAI
jgi:hypothetical protein